MHHAPSNARLQSHVHATSRTPQLHRRDCMAHPESQPGTAAGMSLNRSRFSQKKAGHRARPSVASCVRSRRRELMLCDGWRKVLSRVRSGFGEAGSAPEGGRGEAQSLSNHWFCAGELHCCWTGMKRDDRNLMSVLYGVGQLLVRDAGRL